MQTRIIAKPENKYNAENGIMLQKILQAAGID